MKKKKKKKKSSSNRPGPSSGASPSDNAKDTQPEPSTNNAAPAQARKGAPKTAAAATPPPKSEPAGSPPSEPATGPSSADKTDAPTPDPVRERPAPTARVKLEPKPLKMDPSRDAPRQRKALVREYGQVSLHDLSNHALSVGLDPRLDKNRPRWLQRTMDNVIHYLAVPKKKTLREKIWHHRLRVPVLYALAGVLLAVLANLYDAHRIYRMQGDLSAPPPPIVRPPVEVDDEGVSLVALREKHNQSAYRIENERNVRGRAWPEEYLGKLIALQDALRDRGDFMAWMEVKREVERFSSQQSILEQHIVKEPDELRDLQKAYHDVESRYDVEMQAALVRLHGETLRDLEELLEAKRVDGARADTLRAIEVEIRYMRENPPAEPETAATAEAAAETEPREREEDDAAQPDAPEAPEASETPETAPPPETES